MEKNYNYFKKLLLAWYQGDKTGNEIKEETKDFLDLEEYEKEFDVFIYALEESINDFDDDIGYEWEEYKEYAEDTAPTVNGVCHNIGQMLAGNQTSEEFIDWATWHNLDGGETTSGKFENRSIEFFCLYFIPENYKNLNTDFYQKAIPLLEKSNKLTYSEFTIGLYLLVEKEKKSLYFFLNEYVKGTKNEEDLEKYLVKKFNRNLPDFIFNLSTFPYLDELNRYRDEKLNVGNLLEKMKK
ncbi:MAG: hypothetical protein AAFZ89_12015 [Bacteroidota bacterium]